MDSEKIDISESTDFEKTGRGHTTGIIIVAVLTCLWGVDFVTTGFGSVDSRGNYVGIQLMPIAMGLLLIWLGIGVYRGVNLARWALSVAVLVASILSLSWLVGIYVAHSNFGFLLLFCLPFLFSKKASPHFY